MLRGVGLSLPGSAAPRSLRGALKEPTCPAELNAEECRATLDRRAAFVARHTARFERRYRLDSRGIQRLGEGGLEPIPGAAAVSKVKGDRWTAEVKLPLSALPRMSEAPASTFFLFAAPGPATKAPEIKQRVTIVAPAGIHFDPYGELRAKAYERRSPCLRGRAAREPSRDHVEI
jgi:hypothetical protein